MNICFVTDEGYAMPTGVTIFSIYENRNPKIKYNIYVLCKNVSKESKSKLLELKEKDFNIELVDCDNTDYSNLHIDGIPATPTSIYKFFIPNILSNLDRVLFLDGDIIVKGDLKELYDINIGDNYIGAIKDTNGLDSKKYIDSNFSYINSGVLLMNLSKMREDNIPDKLIDYRLHGYNELMDQDTFNVVLKGKIKLLPFKYNTQMNAISTALIGYSTYNVDNLVKYWNILDDAKSLDDLFNHAIIIHYTTAKPWKYYDGYGNDLWLSYYIKSPYSKTILHRDSYYIKKIIRTKSYILGNALAAPKKKISKIIKNKKRRNHEKFLKQFYNK